MSLRDDETPYLRLEGLVPKMEEFHNQAELLKVMWGALYSTTSPRDIGTMYAARNITDTRNVSADPSGNYYASSTMADKFTDAYIVAGALHHFQMQSTSESPKANKYVGGIGDVSAMKSYLLMQAKEFVTKYVDMDVRELPKYGPQRNTLKCRYCGKSYTQAMSLRKHEHNKHGHCDPLWDNTTTNLSGTEEDDDNIVNYTRCVLLLGLLRKNHNDAICMGDGDRMLCVNQYLYLLYKVSGCPKHAFGILETVCQSKILLSPRLAHRFIWNRTVNHRGKVNTNHPNDLDLEHCNKVFKDEAHSFRGLFTEKTISRVSRNAISNQILVKNFDHVTSTHGGSGEHAEADLTPDVYLILAQLVQEQVYTTIPGRTHQAFPDIKPNPFSKLDMEEVRDWILRSLKKFSAKLFYVKN